MNVKKAVCLLMAACAVFVIVGAALAEDAASTPEISTKLDLAYVTKYVWRGIPLNPDPAIQPSLTFTHKSGVSLNVWGSYDTTNVNVHKNNITEIDYTLNYATKFKGKDVNAGIVTYTFPNTPGPTTSEIYGCYCFGGKLAPTLQAFYDIDKAHGIYVQASAGYTCAIPTMKMAPSLGLAGKIGYGDSNHNKYNFVGADTTGLTDALVSASLPINVSSKVTVTPSVNYSTIINDTIRDAFKTVGLERNNFYAGVTVSFPL